MENSVHLLEGYTALDLTDLKGQLCGRVLADLGMEVIKVEPPCGDPVRRLGPFHGGSNGSGLSLRFAHLNANKKSVILDLQASEGQSAFRRLAARVDVILESFSPGHLDSIGLGYRELTKTNPRLIMASLSGFGQTGPKRDFACTDSVAFAMGGLMYLSGEPNLPPCKPPETQGYYFGSLMTALGVVAALYKREGTGAGDCIDVSIQESLATQEHNIRFYANEKQILKRNGSQHTQVAPAMIFPCRDGHVYLYVTRNHWKRFLQALGDYPAEFDDPDWLNNPFRRARADIISEVVMTFTSCYSKDELTAFLQSHGIPCTPVNRPRDFMADPHIESRRFFVSVPYPGIAPVLHPSPPFIINERRPSVRPAPAAGQHQSECRSGAANNEPSKTRATSGSQDSGAQPPLSGMRILSFDHVLAGPYGMTLLAELGADIIKVESRRGGLDPFRYFGTSQDPNLSPRFLEFNKNKRSITVNLKHPDGPKTIRELIQHCGVIVDNFSVRVMPSLGLGYEDLRQIKPDITTLRMPGLGCTGPKSNYSTLGTNITAFTGFTYLWNHPDHTNPPVGSQTVFPDYVSGTWSAILTVSAELYRKRTGQGVAIDLSQAETAAYMIGVSLMESLISDSDVEPIGNDWPYAAPHGCYPCRGEDRWCVIAVETEEQWRALATVLERPDLLQDDRFQGVAARRQQRAELDNLINLWTRHKECHEVMDRLQRVGVPCGVVQNGADLVEDGHLQARGFIVGQDNERIGHIILPRLPIRFANSTIKSQWAFPELGRDTEDVFRTLLGYNPDRIAQLVRDGLLD